MTALAALPSQHRADHVRSTQEGCPPPSTSPRAASSHAAYGHPSQQRALAPASCAHICNPSRSQHTCSGEHDTSGKHEQLGPLSKCVAVTPHAAPKELPSHWCCLDTSEACSDRVIAAHASYASRLQNNLAILFAGCRVMTASVDGGTLT